MLNVPTLKHTPCCSVWVAVDDLHLTKVHAMACHECMFCQCGSGYITISQCTLMLLQPVFQGSTHLPNVHLRAYCAGDRVDYLVSPTFNVVVTSRATINPHWFDLAGVGHKLYELNLYALGLGFILHILHLMKV